MKTHKFILLLGLLVFAGSFEGWAQVISSKLVYITGTPDNALIILNDSLTVVAPYKYQFESDSVKIRISKLGYYSLDTIIFLSNRNTEFSFELTRLSILYPHSVNWYSEASNSSILPGGFDMLAQTDTRKPSLPDEEVIKLKNELVEALENDEIEKAQIISDSLWAAQREEFEYLSFREYFLSLYLRGLYDKIIEIYPSVYKYNNDTTSVQRIDLELITLALARQQKILDDLEKKYSDFDSLSHKGLFSILTNLEYVTTENQNPKNSINLKQYYYAKEKRNDGFLCQLKYHFPNKNPKYLMDEEVYNGLWLGTGLYYARGWYNGDLKNYMEQYEAFSFLNIHTWYRRLYLELHFGFIGVYNAQDSISTNTKVSLGTHVVNGVYYKTLAGYMLYRSRWLDIIPYVGYLWQNNQVNQIRHKNAALLVEYINHYGLIGGINVDIRLLNDQFNQIGLRLKYEFSISWNNPGNNCYKGFVNHLGIGVIYSGNILY